MDQGAAQPRLGGQGSGALVPPCLRTAAGAGSRGLAATASAGVVATDMSGTASAALPSTSGPRQVPTNSSARAEWSLDAPNGCGLLIRLDAGAGCIRFASDEHLSHLHRHLHIPASVRGVEKLLGGGSGVTIVKGTDPELGSVVMKHGGPRDTAEVFALATIEKELGVRGEQTGSADAAAGMRARIPEFKFLYVSQAHLVHRGAQLWGLLRYTLKAARGFWGSQSSLSDEGAGREHATQTLHIGNQTTVKSCFVQNKPPDEGGGREHATPTLHTGNRTIVEGCSAKKRPPAQRSRICLRHPARRNNQRVRFGGTMTMVDGCLEVLVDAPVEVSDCGELRCGGEAGGYAFLEAIVHELVQLQRSRLWKFTLAQKTIGGEHPTTGAKLLVTGVLHGVRLETLVGQYIKVIRDLQRLTANEETDVVEDIQRELASTTGSTSFDVSKVSSLANAFAGFAIKKNFHPELGRFRRLRDMGALFREGTPLLIDAELLPARLLGKLLKHGTRLEEVFDTGLVGPTALDTFGDMARSLLEHAVSLGDVAVRRIWTCGITDGGLHNLFLGDDHLWLFDLGEPALMPLPAFLTKFLMSFFHTLGMEDAVDGQWIVRFVPGERLRLTQETIALLTNVHAAFRIALNRLVEELFGGERAVCELLRKYVVLQLLSDAAFCLERWEIKGGGVDLGRTQALEKWLWRALWDAYAASDVAAQGIG